MKIDSTSRSGGDLLSALPALPDPEDIYGMSEGYDGVMMEAYGRQCYEAGVLAERERCARLCELMQDGHGHWKHGTPLDCANEIRKG
jgi:hypothetical protein